MATVNIQKNPIFNKELYVKAIHSFYNILSGKSTMDYNLWKENFVRIHGDMDTQHKIDLEGLENAYNISFQGTFNNLFYLIYCLETYYTIILRMIAYKALDKTNSTYSKEIFCDKTFIEKGISNYTCGNYYNWFLNTEFKEDILAEQYEHLDLSRFSADGDSISNLFEDIFPKEIRHSLGEYYTPYWLANYVIDNVTAKDTDCFNKTFIDPTCGSGVFIVALINKYHSATSGLIFKHVCGIDINPIAVLAAKTNYVVLYTKYIGATFTDLLHIPIYCADTIAINDNRLTVFPTHNACYDTVPKYTFDYVVGNPPWVNWEYLPDTYKNNYSELWQYYGLFSRKGLNTNFVKEDISVLLTYVVMDNYLNIGGKLGFIVKKTLFKSVKQGEGFRKFRLIPQNIDLRVDKVEDLSSFNPFVGASTKTALLYITKGEKTSYPVDYILWEPNRGRKDYENLNLSNVGDYAKLITLKATPSNSKINSSWITETEADMEVSKAVLGTNNYIARTGVFTGGANGIFWLNIDRDNGESVMVSNITERAKNKMRKVSMEVEKTFVFPFMVGSDLKFWSYSYSKYILFPHTKETKMYPINQSELDKYPRTKGYFETFRTDLENRKGFTSMDRPIHEKYYYTLQRVGAYTFAPYRVCWRYICKNFLPTVIEYANDIYLGRKEIICNEKIISVAFDNKDEAYYVCGILSSTPYRHTVENYMEGTQITPSIINNLNIPPFDESNQDMVAIAKLCYQGHSSDNKEEILQKIDDIVLKELHG